MRESPCHSRARGGYSLLSLLLLIAIVAVCLASIRLAVLKPSGDRTSGDVAAMVVICGVFSVLMAVLLSSILGWRWYQIMGAVPLGILFGLAAGATATLPLDWPALFAGPLVLLAIAWNSAAPNAAQDVARSSTAWDAEPQDAEMIE